MLLSVPRFRSAPIFGALAFLAFLFLLAAQALSAITGTVVGVSDGDTITVLQADRTTVRVRLAEIDTPEKRQPYGQRAKQALARLVFRKQVRIEPVDRDRYGRIVGQVYVGDQWINQIMVCEGHAWVYRRYATSRTLVACEEGARAAKRGLWALPEAQRQPPWEWRREKTRDAPASESSEVDRSEAIDCTRRWTCRMFRSCEEAQAVFHQCGQKSLDGDRDGIPCERLCRSF